MGTKIMDYVREGLSASTGSPIGAQRSEVRLEAQEVLAQRGAAGKLEALSLQ